MELWEKNVRALAYKNKRLADEMERLILQGGSNRVQTETLENGKKVLTLTRNGYKWHLNSRLDPESAVQLYTDRYAIKPFYRYFVFGLNDGMAVRSLLGKCDESNAVIIYEPDKEIMAEAVRKFDLEDLFLDERVWISISEMWREMSNVVFHMMEYSYIKLAEFCILPAYDILYTEECEKFMDEVLDKIRYEIVQRKTFENFDQKIPANMLFHLKNMIGQRNCAQVKQELQKAGIDGIPAIIIAAGPSLDKNIKEIKNAEGKAFIFVVDAALRTVIREGITPNLVCTVDPSAPERFFETIGEREFLWACSCWANPNPIREYGGKVFYYNSIAPWWDAAVLDELGYKLPRINAGGSVSTEAFQLARYFGFRTIIFIGQDLAFTGGLSHTKGIDGVLGENDAYIAGRYVVWTEDADGNPLETDFQMNYYRQWIEKEIREDSQGLRVIDATEGGAKIGGTIDMPLRETIQQECLRRVEIQQCLERIEPAFTEAQQKRLNAKAEELRELQAEFSELVEKEIFLQKNVLKEFPQLNEERLAGKLKEISRQNEAIHSHPFIDWITLYASKEEFEMKEDIYAKEEMSIPEILERGIRLLESYQKGMPKFEADLSAALEENHERT